MIKLIERMNYLQANSKFRGLSHNVDGYMWVIDGKVYVKNAINGGMPPAISPCNNVQLTINGAIVNHLAFVKEADDIRVTAKDSFIPKSIHLDISDDWLFAHLIYQPSLILKNRIADKLPVNKLDVEVISEKIKTEETVTRDDLLKILARSGIRYGIIENEVERICDHNESGRFLIAKGVPPQEPTDDEIEYKFSEESFGEIDLNPDEKGRVNF